MPDNITITMTPGQASAISNAIVAILCNKCNFNNIENLVVFSKILNADAEVTTEDIIASDYIDGWRSCE